MKSYWSLARESVNSFMEDKALRLSAALAYYSIFSIAPLLIIVIAVAGFFMGEDAVRQQIQQQLKDYVGPQGTAAITSMVGAHKQGTSIIATIIGVVVLLFGASGVFGQLQDSLNAIWGVELKPGRGFWYLIKSRFLSFAMVLGIGFLLLVSMVITAILSALTGALGNVLPMAGFVAHLVNFIASFVVTTLLFAAIFKVLPDARVRWREVWMGAVFTALLFTIGKYVFAWYLGRAAVASSYGAAGSLVVVLLWVYYSSVILFFGAEFTKVHAKEGFRILPTPNALPVTAEAKAEQGIPRTQELQYTEVTTGGEATSPGRELQTGSKTSTLRKTPRKAFQEVIAETEWKGIAKAPPVIHEKPWPYVGLALGLGMATGWVVKRDFTHRRGLFKSDLLK